MNLINQGGYKIRCGDSGCLSPGLFQIFISFNQIFISFSSAFESAAAKHSRLSKKDGERKHFEVCEEFAQCRQNMHEVKFLNFLKIVKKFFSRPNFATI